MCAGSKDAPLKKAEAAHTQLVTMRVLNMVVKVSVSFHDESTYIRGFLVALNGRREHEKNPFFR
jgi:hypothetical protein